jgi:hypothetical protein
MRILAITIGLALINCLSVDAATLNLYQPSAGLTPNTSTADGGPYLNFGQSGGGTQNSLGLAGTNLNTTNANTTAAGYSNRGVNILTNPVTPGALINSSFPNLDRSTGFTLKFNVEILSESSASSDRAGFSVIALSSDRQGIEIGFQDNFEVGTVFAQNLNFTQGDNFSSFELLGIFRSPTDYELEIFGNTYTLRANNNQILNGNLRLYNDAALFNPYKTPNFIFLGDDTSQAQANINLRNVSITTTAVPFEFSPALGLVAVGAWAIAKKLTQKST